MVQKDPVADNFLGFHFASEKSLKCVFLSLKSYKKSSGYYELKHFALLHKPSCLISCYGLKYFDQSSIFL